MAGNFIELTQSVTSEERRLWRALPTKCGSFSLNPVLWGTYNISASHSAMQNFLNSAFPKTRSGLHNGSLSVIEYEQRKTLNGLTTTSSWYFKIWSVGKSDIIACSGYVTNLIHNFFPPVALRPNAGHGLLILEVSRSHTTTHHNR